MPRDKKEDILKLVSQNYLVGKLLIFKTEWNQEFNIYSHNMSNPFFEFRHPYLTYPFLDYDTIKWLVSDIKIQGIGCETCGVDNPAYYAKPHFLPTYATQYYSSIKPLFRPASVLLLTNSLYYINHLANLDKLNLPKKYLFGKSCIIPIPFGTNDAHLVKIIFVEKV